MVLATLVRFEICWFTLGYSVFAVLGGMSIEMPRTLTCHPFECIIAKAVRLRRVSIETCCRSKPTSPPLTVSAGKSQNDATSLREWWDLLVNGAQRNPLAVWWGG